VATDTTPDRFLLHETGAGAQAWMGRNLITIKAVTDDTDGHYGLIVSEAPRGSAPPMHIHHRTDEAIWIIEGRLRLVCGESDVVIGAGAFTLLPRGVPHTFLALEDTKMLGIMSPGGTEGYYFEGGVPKTSDTPPPVDVARMVEAGSRFDVEVTGEPLAGEE